MVKILREADTPPGADAAKKHGISDVTLYSPCTCNRSALINTSAPGITFPFR